MTWLMNDRRTYKIRIYVLACQNLSAIDTSVGIRERFAGMKALCSADPFPVVILGDGRNSTKD